MKQTIHRRLQTLETLSARKRQVREAEERRAQQAIDVERAREKLREDLRIRGVVQEGNESLAEALARYLGITCMQLKNYLKARAAEAISQ